MHFLPETAERSSNFQWSYLARAPPVCSGRSLKVVSARPVMRHMTIDVALLPILIYSAILDPQLSPAAALETLYKVFIRDCLQINLYLILVNLRFH